MKHERIQQNYQATTRPIGRRPVNWLLTLSSTPARGEESPTFVDLSLLVAAEYPCTVPIYVPPFRIDHVQKIGRQSAYNVDTLSIDGNTATQMDVPPHSVQRPELNLPKSGPFGNEFTDKVPAWKFVGEACVVDLRELLDAAPAGVSSLVRRRHFEDWGAESSSAAFRRRRVDAQRLQR